MLLEKKELEGRKVALTLRVEKDAWGKALADVYQQVKIAYPSEDESRAALEEKYGVDFLYQEGVNATYPQALVEAINKEDILIAGTPALEIVTIGPDGYDFKATVDLYPEVKLGQYKGLTAAYPQVQLTEQDTEEAVAEFLRGNIVQEHPEKAAMGDQVTIDFEGFVDGVPFEGGKAEQYPLVLGGGMFIPGFEEQLAGIKVGEERDVNVTFPEQYTPELAGKAAVFKCKCHDIMRQSVPSLTEEFAKEQGFEDVSALRRRVMADALDIKTAQAADEFADKLIEMVIATMETEIPASMVDSQLDGLIAELSRHMQAQGMELQQYLEMAHVTEEQLREHSRTQAEMATKFELAMTEIARLENIVITDEELTAQYEEMSRMYGVPAAEIRKQLPEVRLKHDMKLQKARYVVVSTAKRA